MASSIITKVRLYRTDPLTRIRTLAFRAGASVPVEVYERLTGEAVHVEPPAAPEAAAPAKAKNPTVAELKARLDDLGVEYPSGARLAQLADLLEQAEADGDES